METMSILNRFLSILNRFPSLSKHSGGKPAAVPLVTSTEADDMRKKMVEIPLFSRPKTEDWSPSEVEPKKPTKRVFRAPPLEDNIPVQQE